ncbi:MAG: 30S ribosomal protein S7 [Kiritimatiellae bacterium]|nr:30S ribosomal protein S7 [Kiritimatiellia bacterium]MDW8457515.1 30S ribosomal protein S7 [Verrucomicrobiota bacterium]
MRRRRAEKRPKVPDLRYNSVEVGGLITKVMRRGKRAVAERIVYSALDAIAEQTKQDPLEVLKAGLENVKPKVEVKSRRVGGATYQVPVEVEPDRQTALAMRWIVTYAKERKGLPMRRALAMEIIDASKNQGNAVKKKEDTHKMAQANKAFAHYRW